MIGAHPSFPWPADRSVKLWRYMDLSKFVSLVQTKTFWMSRADTLGDPLEGSITAPMKAALVSQFRDHPEALVQMAEFNRGSVRDYFVSCWHENEHESAAMWKLYSQSLEAVCIQTTFNKLSGSLPASINGGKVIYIDYEMDAFGAGNIFNMIMHKRKSFEHEREYRFVAWSRLAPDKGGKEIVESVRGDGVAWALEPENYVDSIYVSPTAPAWFSEVVARVASDYGLSASVRQSSLLRDPIF